MALGTSKMLGLLGTFARQRATKHIVLAASQLVLIGLFMHSSNSWSRNEARELFQHLRHGEVLTSGQQEAEKIDASLAPSRFSIAVTDAQKTRLEDQRREARSRARFHLKTMVTLFANYYMSVMLFSLTGAMAAISLVLISKKGWNEANEYIVTLFFIMTASTVFFGALPNLFLHEETVGHNKRLYLRYVALEDAILSYAATGLHSPLQGSLEEKAGAPLEAGTAVGGSGALPPITYRELAPKEFILHVDRELARDDIPIGLDYSKAPTYKGAFELQPGR